MTLAWTGTGPSPTPGKLERERTHTAPTGKLRVRANEHARAADVRRFSRDGPWHPRERDLQRGPDSGVPEWTLHGASLRLLPFVPAPYSRFQGDGAVAQPDLRRRFRRWRPTSGPNVGFALLRSFTASASATMLRWGLEGPMLREAAIRSEPEGGPAVQAPADGGLHHRGGENPPLLRCASGRDELREAPAGSCAKEPGRRSASLPAVEPEDA